MKEITPQGELVDRLVNNEIDKWVNRDIQVLDNDTVLYLANEIIEIDDTASGGDPETQVLVGLDTDLGTSATTRRGRYGRPWTRCRWTCGLGGAADLKNWLRAKLARPRPARQLRRVAGEQEPGDLGLAGPDRGSSGSSAGRTATTSSWTRRTGSTGSTRRPRCRTATSWCSTTGRAGRMRRAASTRGALELTLNTYDLSAIKVWEYRHAPDLYARGRSSAFRMANGNTIINFETNEVDPPRVLVEADRDGDAVWTLEIRSPSLRNSFRAYTMESIAGEREGRVMGGRWLPGGSRMLHREDLQRRAGQSDQERKVRQP